MVEHFNGLTVVYQLAEEKVYECTDLDLITYQNETNLVISSGALNPKVSLKVSKGVGNTVKMLQNKVTIAVITIATTFFDAYFFRRI